MERQKADQASSAMDSDECSSVTGGEEFVAETFNTHPVLETVKVCFFVYLFLLLSLQRPEIYNIEGLICEGVIQF